MEKQMKLFTNMTKPFVLFVLLFAFGVGEMWADGTKRIYCEYSNVSSWWGSTVYVYAWGGGHDAKKYTMTATGTTDLMRCDIDDYHTNLLFYKSDSEGGSWTKQSNDVTIGSNNRWSMQDGGWEQNCTINNEQRYAPGTAIDGLVDIKNPHNQMFTDGEFTATLAAHTTYEFKILETSTLYGLNDLIATSSISNKALNTSGYQVRLCTAGAGTYTFAYNTTNHQLSITYPTTDHPSIDYCYVIDYSWSPSANLHVWNGTSTKVAEWNGSSTIAGSTWPGAALSNKTTIGGQSYFYIAPANFANFLVSKNGDSTDRSGDLTSSDGYGKRRYWNGSSWIWDTFTVRIQLNDLGAGTAVNPTYMDVAFNSDVLDDLTSIPVKNGYTFGGFYSGYDAVNEEVTGVQVIDDSGNWIASVSDYTDASTHWIHAGMSTTIYAKWTEDKHTVNVAVSPAGAGSVQVNSSNVSSVTDVGIATKSAEMTPIALPGWKFKEWQATSNVQMDLLNYHRDYQQGSDNKMKINATADAQTITAVFEPRYYLVGKIWDDSADGGMPGWENYNKPFKVVTTSPVLDTCKVTLETNKSFYIEVRDKTDGYSYGKSDGTLNDNTTLTFTDKDNKVFVYSNGGTEYTFKITAIDGSGHPTVSVERPYQVNIGRKRVDIDGTDHDDNTGGTAAMSKTSGGDAVSNGAWVPYGTGVTYTASPTTGYSVAWYSSSDYSGNPFTTDAVFYHTATSTGNGYAKFTEKTTTVSLENDGHGKVQIGGVDKTGTTVGVTTTRSLTAVPNDGYAFKDWSKPSGDDITLSSTSANPTTLTGVGAGLNEGQRVYASFSEIARTITASAGTGGTVGAASYTAYIDTKADISATPATGYKFKEWQETGGTSNVTFDDVHSASTKIKATGDATIQAVFEPRWAIAGSWKTYPESAAWDADTYKLGNIGTNGSSKDTCYVEITIPANANLTFKIVDRGADGTVAIGSYVDYGNNTTATQYMTYNNHTNWGLGLKSSGYYDCGITTTGGGAYKFAFNITDKSLTVTYPTSYQSNFGWKYADGAGTLHDGDNGGTITVTASDGGSHTISSGQWVAAGASITYTASPAVGYAFAGWHTDDTYGTWFSNDNPWTNSDIKAASNAYAKFVPVTVTYNDESGDGKWSTASNWSPACVPTIDHDVVITKPVTVDIAHATANRIVLDQNSHTGKLTIQANKGLEVVGTITRTTDGSNRLATRPEDLILESSSAGNASLIFNNSNSCQATVQMYSIGDIDGDKWNWQFMGTPFTSANALYSYYGSYLYEWKAGGYWDAVANGGTMTPFTGYCITQDDPTYYVMDGTLNPNSDVNISIPASKEFVMANSWSAPISVHNFTSTTLPLDDKTIYLFNTGFAPKENGDAEQGTAAGTYIAMPINSAIYTGNYLIAPMEGFYVDNRGHDAATITLKYDELVRPSGSHTDIVAGAMHAPKRVAAEAEPDVMKIKATGSRYSERIVILEREDFSAGFDNGWDGKNLNEPGVAPILYALREDGTKDAVSAIPSFEGTVVGFRQGEDNQYTFSFNYDGEDIWYLNDLKEEKSTLIDAANTYSFVAEAGDAEARFIISATPIQKLPTGIGNDANDAMAKVRKLIINDQLFIIRAGRMYNAVGSIVK